MVERAELNAREWEEVLRRLKKYAISLTKGGVLRGSSDDADDLVLGAVTKWLKRDLAWKSEFGLPTVPAVVGYLKPAVRRLYLDSLKRSASQHEVSWPDEDGLSLSDEVQLLQEHLDHLVYQLRPFVQDDVIAECYIDLLLESDEIPSGNAAADALGVELKDIRNMKKRLDGHIRTMKVTMPDGLESA